MTRTLKSTGALGALLFLVLAGGIARPAVVWAEGQRTPGGAHSERPQLSGAMAAWREVAFAPVADLENPAGDLPTRIESLSSAVLPDGRFLTPYGSQVEVGDLPLGMVESPDGTVVAVANSGAGTQTVSIVSVATGRVVQTLEPKSPKGKNEMYAGLAFSPDGGLLFVAGGGANEVYAYAKGAEGRFTPAAAIPVAGYPTSLAMSPDGKTLYVTDNLANTLTAIRLDGTRATSQTTIPVGSYPFAIAVSPDGNEVYVSNWGSSSLSIVDAVTMQEETQIPLWAAPVKDAVDVGTLPGSIVLSKNGSTAYVSEADENAIAVVDIADRRVTERLSVDPYRGAPAGIAPNGLALSPGGRRLYTTEGMLNAVGVYSLPEKRWLGQVPVGWYPTAVLVDPGSGRIIVANSNGVGSGPNLQSQWVGAMIHGTLSLFPPPSRARLAQTTKSVVADTVRVAKPPEGSPIPTEPGAGPIKHVILIVRENKTYDEDFGDITEGNGDASLTIYPEKVTPNAHALATTFGLMDNYYVDGEVTAQGHEWVAGAGPTDYVQRTWSAYYSGRGRVWDSGIPGTIPNTDTFGWEQDVYKNPGAGSLPISYPKLGYLFNDALRSGISFTDYGEFVEHDPVTGNVLGSLMQHMQANYPGWNLKIPDTRRAAIFIKNLDEGVLPTFSYVFLMDDHTAGTTPGYPNPNAEVANNDYATGEIVAAVSRSKFWKDSAIFVVEDDAQSGGDHVDAHRSIVMVASPYARRHVVIDAHYDQMSVIKTIELITGMKPLTVNDAYATPMWKVFTSHPDFAPFSLLPEKVPYRFSDPATQNSLATVDAALSLASGITRQEGAPGGLQRRILDDYFRFWRGGR